MAPQQSRLASLSPAQAPLLLSLNGSMLYVGTALGAVISGALLEQVGFAHLGWVGVPFGLLAMLTLVFDRMPARVPASAPLEAFLQSDHDRSRPARRLANRPAATARRQAGRGRLFATGDAAASLAAALPERFGEVLSQLLNRLESSALFTEESCSFSRKDLLDSLQLWLDKAGCSCKIPEHARNLSGPRLSFIHAPFAVRLLIALLPLRGWVGDAMATQMAAGKIQHQSSANCRRGKRAPS
jgi:MFS family permease